MIPVERTWKLTDHMCVKCGGRILRCVTGNGMSPGGNPLYKCSCCNIATWSLGQPMDLCWCGMTFRGQTESAYMCLPFSILKDYPDLENLFKSCGHDPNSGMDIGVVTVKSYREVMEKLKNEYSKKDVGDSQG